MSESPEDREEQVCLVFPPPYYSSRKKRKQSREALIRGFALHANFWESTDREQRIREDETSPTPGVCLYNFEFAPFVLRQPANRFLKARVHDPHFSAVRRYTSGKQLIFIAIKSPRLSLSLSICLHRHRRAFASRSRRHVFCNRSGCV